MRTRLIGDGRRSDASRYRARDLAFTAMLAAQCLIIFAIPFAAIGYEGVREVVALLFFIFTFLVCLISPGRVPTILAILAFISGLAGYVLERVAPSTTIALILVFVGAVSAFVVATYALGYAALVPGKSDVSSGAGGGRTLLEHRPDVWRDISNDLVFYPKFFD